MLVVPAGEDALGKSSVLILNTALVAAYLLSDTYAFWILVSIKKIPS